MTTRVKRYESSCGTVYVKFAGRWEVYRVEAGLEIFVHFESDPHVVKRLEALA